MSEKEGNKLSPRPSLYTTAMKRRLSAGPEHNQALLQGPGLVSKYCNGRGVDSQDQREAVWELVCPDCWLR